jgi:hypothetical protein
LQRNVSHHTMRRSAPRHRLVHDIEQLAARGHRCWHAAGKTIARLKIPATCQVVDPPSGEPSRSGCQHAEQGDGGKVTRHPA